MRLSPDQVAEGRTFINRVNHLDRGYEQLEQKLTMLGARVETRRVECKVVPVSNLLEENTFSDEKMSEKVCEIIEICIASGGESS